MRKGFATAGQRPPTRRHREGAVTSPPAERAYISGMGFDSPEKLVIVFLTALIVLGPSRLPELGRSLGQGVRGFKDSVEGRDEPGDHPPRQP